MNVLQNLDSLDSFDPLVALKKQRKIEWLYIIIIFASLFEKIKNEKKLHWRIY